MRPRLAGVAVLVWLASIELFCLDPGEDAACIDEPARPFTLERLARWASWGALGLAALWSVFLAHRSPETPRDVRRWTLATAMTLLLAGLAALQLHDWAD